MPHRGDSPGARGRAGRGCGPVRERRAGGADREVRDLVKLDISLIHNHPSRVSGEVMNGVCAYAESTGAAVLAEGVEDEQHIIAATSLEAKARELGEHAVVVAAFQDVRRFTPATSLRYRRLASRAAFAAALGVRMPEEFVLTFERDLVVAVAAALISRVTSTGDAQPLALVA